MDTEQADQAGGAEHMRAWRTDVEEVHLSVVGSEPAGHDVEIVRSPLRIHPPQFDLVIRPGTGRGTRHRYKAVLRTSYPGECRSVTVNHAGGHEEVEIEDVRTEEWGLRRSDR